MPKQGDYGVKVQPGDWILLTKKGDGACWAGHWTAVRDLFGDIGVKCPDAKMNDLEGVDTCYMLGSTILNLEPGTHGEPGRANWFYIIEQLVCEGAL